MLDAQLTHGSKNFIPIRHPKVNSTRFYLDGNRKSLGFGLIVKFWELTMQGQSVPNVSN